MKVLGISLGTKNGNNDAMCKEALMAAQANGAEIEFIRPLDLNLKPCTGCIACVGKLMQGKDGGCIIKDDMAWLEDKLLEADGIIMAVPIFEKGVPAIFRIIQDRFSGPSHDRGMVMISKMIGEKNGNPGPDPRNFKDKFISYIAIGGSDWATRVSTDEKLFAMTPMWKVIDDEVFTWSKSIATDDAKVAKCHEIGVNMAEALKNPEAAEYKGDPGICPHCYSRNFYLNNNATEAICEVCGIVGEIKVVNGEIKFEFPEEQLEHAHDTIPGKMHHAEDIKKNEGQLIEDKKTEKYKTRMEKYKNFINATMPTA